MPKNAKHYLAVRRRDAVYRNAHVAGTLVTPVTAPRESWWTTARREGFTQQASQAPRASTPNVSRGTSDTVGSVVVSDPVGRVAP
jgi:hypothetical protein